MRAGQCLFPQLLTAVLKRADMSRALARCPAQNYVYTPNEKMHTKASKVLPGTGKQRYYPHSADGGAGAQ